MRPETKQLLKNISIGFGIFLLVGLLLYGVWYGTRLPSLTIDDVVVTGGETISREQVATDVNILLGGEYARFIPRRFAWTYPEREIMEKILEVDRIKDPVVQRRGKQLQITVAEYKPIALWCGAQNPDDCVFLDTDGYGFAATPDLTGGAFVRYVRIGEPASTSNMFTVQHDFVLLRELVLLLDEYGWPVATVELDQARDVFVYLAGGGELKITLLQTPSETLDNLQTILSNDEYSHLEPGKFEYIDLRFGNKVFVNEFGAPVEEVKTEAATSTTQNAASSDNAA